MTTKTVRTRNIIVLSKAKLGDEGCIRVVNEKSRNFKEFDEFHLKMDENCIMDIFDPGDSMVLSVIKDVMNNNNGKFDTQKELIDAIMKDQSCSNSKAMNMIKKAIEKKLIKKEDHGQHKVKYELV